MHDITVIIPHLGMIGETEDLQQRRHSLHTCLRSIIETCTSKIIITENGGSMPIFFPQVAIDNKDRFNWIANWEQGQCKAVNAAAATVNTKWLFITNDDMIYAPGWLEKLMTTAEQYKLKYVCPNLVEPQQGAPPFLTYFCGGAGGDFDKKKWLDYAAKHEDHTLEQGFNLPFLIDRELWQRIGGYDINYDPWGSNGDSDLQAKLILAGLCTFRDRNVIVYHFSQTSGTFHPDNHAFWEKNYAYFREKWGFDRQPASEKVWYSREIIDHPKLIYHPEWEKVYKYRDNYMMADKGFKFTI